MSRLRDIIREKLENGADGFLCLTHRDGIAVPALLTSSGLNGVELAEPGGTRYPLAKILSRLQKERPEARFGVLVRGCDQRAMIELSKLEQLDLARIVMVGVACTAEEAEACGCAKPYPEEVSLGEKVESGRGLDLIEKLEAMPEGERMQWWKREFSRCIKCYGCRNICPMCFCKECSLEDPYLVEPGRIPPEFPSFHIIRALDMAGRCIDCGLCEEACPAQIPLRDLYRKMQEIMADRLDYRAGESRDEKNPLSFLGEEADIEKLE
jgi:formate hydrogenlyase subunit 6/NADH:ubiquinone oxidoreductase subunit I